MSATRSVTVPRDGDAAFARDDAVLFRTTTRPGSLGIAVLSTPTRDSIAVRVGMAVTSFDTASVVTKDYRALFVQALRQQLKLPQPLPGEFYASFTPHDDVAKSSGVTVVPAIAVDYRG